MLVSVTIYEFTPPVVTVGRSGIISVILGNIVNYKGRFIKFFIFQLVEFNTP